jgi:hypothetical protein
MFNAPLSVPHSAAVAAGAFVRVAARLRKRGGPDMAIRTSPHPTRRGIPR